MKFRNLVCMSALATCIAFSALAQGLPQASKPEEVGLSSERLKRVTAAFQADVDKGAVAGAVVLIARDGKLAVLRSHRLSGSREKDPDAQRRDLPDRLDEQAHHLRRHHDAGRGRQDPARGPDLGLSARNEEPQVGVEKTDAAGGNAELSLEPASAK